MNKRESNVAPTCFFLISQTGWSPFGNTYLAGVIQGQVDVATGVGEAIFLGPKTYDMTSSNQNPDGTCNLTGYRDYCNDNSFHFSSAGLFEHGTRWARWFIENPQFNVRP